MASIPQVSTALQSVLTNVANTTARISGFICRQRQLNGAVFVQALVFGFLAKPTATLTHLTQSAANVGVTLSPQGLAQRLTQAAAACLQTVLEVAVQQVVAAKPVAIPILQRFTGVYVLDSPTISLPDALAPVWRGQRRGRIRQEARDKGRPISTQALALADWTICVTTPPRSSCRSLRHWCCSGCGGRLNCCSNCGKAMDAWMKHGVSSHGASSVKSMRS